MPVVNPWVLWVVGSWVARLPKDNLKSNHAVNFELFWLEFSALAALVIWI